MSLPPLVSPHVQPFAGMDIRTLIDTMATLRGSAPCLIWEPFEEAPGGEARVWSYAAFAEAVGRVAAGLVKRGVTPGARLVLHLENCPESVICWLGAAYAGAVPVTTNANSSADELAYFADHSGAVAGITQPKFAELLGRAAPALSWIAVTETDGGADPGPNRPSREQSVAALVGDPADLPRRPHDPMAPFGIQYTSGTTSRPKAVLWTHANALWGAKVNAAHEDLRPEDVHLVTMPLFHTNAQAYSVLAALWVGAAVVVQPKFSASRFWPVSLKHGCTWASLVPFCLRALMAQEVPKTHAYRFWGNGICAPPTDAHFRVKTIGWWGMTETISHGTVGSPHHPDRPMSMGRPAPEYAVRVATGSGAGARPGETGDLLIGGHRGLSLFAEYSGNAQATADSFDEEGWFLTGDRVTVAEDGYLVFADRAKDMLKVGGENVAASEIERVIATVPGVREVAVVGKPDPMYDEVPVAFVLPDLAPTEAGDLPERVLAACESGLARFKWPREIRLVEALPRATLEKIAKADLRARLAAEAESR